MSTIHLYTKDNKWEYNAKKEGDPFFSTFLAGMKEAAGELPDELLLDSSVGEVVEQGWESYMCIFMASCVVEGTLEGYKRAYSLRHITGWIQERTLMQLILLYASSTDARVLSRLASVLDMPRGWHAYVSLPLDVPLEDRINHHLSMCCALKDMGQWMYDPEDVSALCLPSETRTMERHITSLLTQCATPSETGSEDVAEQRTMNNLLIVALLLNAHLGKSDSSDELNLYSIDWEVVPEVLKRIGIIEPLKPMWQGPPLLDLAKVLIGKGDTLALPSGSLHIEYDIQLAWSIPKSNIASGSTLKRLYDALWDSLPVDIDVRMLGTQYITQDPIYRDSVGSTSFLSVVHESIARNLSNSLYQPLKASDFRVLILYYHQSIVGLKGIGRLVQAFEARLESYSGETKKRVQAFIGCAAYYLLHSRPSGASVDFPKENVNMMIDAAYYAFKGYKAK